MARKKRSSDVGEGANWMDTYGDLVTLLLCFFVLLFSFSTVDAEKWEALVGALTGTGTGVIPVMNIETAMSDPIEFDIVPNTEKHEKEQDAESEARDLENFLALVSSLQTFIDEHNLNADLFPEQESLTVILRINENVLFDSGDAALKPDSHEVLNNLAGLFADNMTIISAINIEGHTDTDPIRTSQFEDNLDLSSKRANNTARFILENERIDVKRVRSIGMSEYHPVATNETSEGKAANRRVDFIIQSVISDE
ncbi:MAG: OmpA family protein [Clostridiales bacterium]|nr:OmpA family protein [Clostridiales bacterium]